MPRHPGLSGTARALPPSVFDRLWPRVRASGHELAPLHIGDTYVTPPASGRLSAVVAAGDVAEDYRYPPPAGRSDLIDAVVRKVGGLNELMVTADNVQITAGSTHALTIALHAACAPGDEVLLATPYWPLIRGIVRSLGLIPVEVPVSQTLYAAPDTDLAALLEPYVTARTAAIYYASPNNPDGKVLDRGALEGIAGLARRHDLWVVADEVYEHCLFDGRQHVSMASLPGMAERTLTAFSFSKSFALAGLRVGYLVAPREVAAAARALTTHSIYSVSAAAQRAALGALDGGGEFISETRQCYREARDRAVRALRFAVQVPEGATYLFVDLAPFSRPGEDAMAVLERVADAGILLAPGSLFGAASAGRARLCFTAVPPPALDQALERLNRALGV